LPCFYCIFFFLFRAVMDFFRVLRRYVPCKGIAQIRWKCDDPTEFRPSTDLFDVQDDGFPEDFGKKDPRTTFQPVMYCLVCETEMSSIKTLGLHCEGTDHQKHVARIRNKERREDSKIEVLEGDLERMWNEQNPTAARPIHGRKFVLKYADSHKKINQAIYFCCLKECQTFRGNTLYMLRHISSDAHMAASANHPSESHPLTIIVDHRDFTTAKEGQIPDSFWSTQAKLYPREPERRSEEPARLIDVNDLDDDPMEDLRSPSYNCGLSSAGGGPARVQDLQYDPNVAQFDKTLHDFIGNAFQHRVERVRGFSASMAEREFKDMYAGIKKLLKREHLKKGEPMETIKLTKEDMELVDDLIGKRVSEMTNH